ncbi:MAG: STAS/SEC14 domain-containing protein [Nesterenkonia sp.]
MIEFLESSEDLVAVRASGRVEKKDWEAITSALRAALSRHERVSVYVNLVDLESISAGAVAEDLMTALKSLGSLHQFHRAAVVTQAGWIETMVPSWLIFLV